MPDKYLVPEKSTLSILDNNVDFESHAIITPPPPKKKKNKKKHTQQQQNDNTHPKKQHTTGTVPQHFQCFD